MQTGSIKRIVLLLCLVGFAFAAVEPAFARKRARKATKHRATVVVHQSFPIRRAMPMVVVRPARRPIFVPPTVFLAPVMWTGVVVSLPAREEIQWEDSEKIDREDDWTEFNLNADAHGTRLFLEIQGRSQLNFAEVVFGNGEAQVVDFSERTRPSGLYSLLDFRDGRKIDHVRLVARARSDEAKFILRLQR